MKVERHFLRLAQVCVVLCLTLAYVGPLPCAVMKWALVASANSKLQDISLVDLVKLCKGTQKAWPDGRNFTIVIHDPESPEMRSAIEKLFGVDALEVKSLVAKLNESRVMIKVVQTDEDLMRTVEATPGAVGLVDVYAINSSVKVLRIDGKLPFDTGYALKGH
jgi:ribosomal protein L23